ncbi:hypothetical protein ALT785_470097 [Alteromonas infernus]
MGAILTNNSVLSLLITTNRSTLKNAQEDKLDASNHDREDRLEENIYTVLEFAKVKLGIGYFFHTLLCLIYGGFAIGASVHLLFAKELKGLSSYIRYCLHAHFSGSRDFRL